MKTARIYERVSTDEQDLTRQADIERAVLADGYYITGIYREKASGARADRPELLAELAIVPVGASGFDAAAMADLLEVVNLAKDYNTNLKVKILLTRIDPRTKDGKEMLDFLHENNLTVFDSRICERVTFRRATSAVSSFIYSCNTVTCLTLILPPPFRTKRVSTLL